MVTLTLNWSKPFHVNHEDRVLSEELEEHSWKERKREKDALDQSYQLIKHTGFM